MRHEPIPAARARPADTVAARPAGRLPRASERVSQAPPHLYFLVSAIFHYLGPSFAVLLFARVQVLGVAWLRIVSAAVIFAAWRRPWRALARLDRSGRWLLLGWGVALAVMNACFYEAISRLPLGTVSAIEFLPVIGLAAIGARSARNLAALAAAVAGVYLLTDVQLTGAVLGFVFAFANAALFAVYIVLADRVAKRPGLSGIDGLGAAMLIAAIAVCLIGGWQVAPAFTDPVAIMAGIGVGISSSVIPYVTDQLAMARLPRATYATMVALLPAIATAIGIVVLSQIPSLIEIAGIALVVAGVAVHRPHDTDASRPRSRGHRLVKRTSPPMSTDERPANRAVPQLPDTAAVDPMQASASAVTACLGVTGNDDVLVLCNEPQHEIGQALATAARGLARTVRVLEYPAASRPSEEPPAPVAEAMLGASVVFAVTAFSISHTRARRAATRHGVRIASLPKITADIFSRTILVDYDQLRVDGDRLAARLTAAHTCHVSGPGGTDVRLSLRGRSAVCDDGNLAEPGAFGNLPAGEAYIAPLETSGDGIIVFDGTLAGYGMLTEPLSVTLRDGRAVDASGAAAQWLLEALDAGGQTGRQIAELGIGTNPRARMTGTMVEDEKALGTAHLAFGTSVSFGGVNSSNVHIDGLITRPTITLDGRVLLRDGEPLHSTA